MRAKDETGRWGEATAARYLTAEGWEVLDRNWRCEHGELDIVAREGAVLAFCEVKTRPTLAFGDPAEAVTRQKAARIRQLAGQWLRDHPGSRTKDIRFDVIAVLRPVHGPATLRLVRAAF